MVELAIIVFLKSSQFANEVIMTKVFGPLHSDGALGKFDGSIYSKNKYGWYTRPYVIPNQPNSAEQLLWRDYFQTLCNDWSDPTVLTLDRLNQWQGLSERTTEKNRFGHHKHPNARDLFIRCNIYRLRAGLPIGYDPPKVADCDYYPQLTLIKNSTGIQLEVDPLPTANQFVFVSEVPPQNIARNFCPRNFKYLDCFFSGDPHPYTLRAAADITSTNKRYFYRCIVVDNSGRPSSEQILYIDAQKISDDIYILPTIDSYITSTNPFSNYGNSTYLFCKRIDGGSEYSRVLLFFDLSFIPSEADITVGDLSLYCWDKWYDRNVSVHEILDKIWLESEVTWFQRITGTNWGTPGMQADVDYDSSSLDTTLIDGLGWITWDCLSHVRNVVNNFLVRRGLVLISADDFCDFSFYSKDYGGAELPSLHVVYTAIV